MDFGLRRPAAARLSSHNLRRRAPRLRASGGQGPGSAVLPAAVRRNQASVFLWDALARYDLIDHLHFRPDIERLRLEVRPERGPGCSPTASRSASRAVGDLGTDHNADNARNFDNYRSRGASIERYYVEAKPGRPRSGPAAFGMPLVASEMIWDRDIQTPGSGRRLGVRHGRTPRP